MSENMQFGAVTDIYMAKILKYDILAACNINQWDLYNSIADCLKLVFNAYQLLINILQ